MAVKREFGEKQWSQVTGNDEPANKGMPGDDGTESIDNLVSSFLAELTDLSSKITQNERAGIDPRLRAGTSDIKPLPHFRLQEETPSQSSPDLKDIDVEIEKSLAELEDLKSAAVALKADSVPEAPLQSKRSAESRTAVPMGSPKIPLPGDPEDQAWKRLELFRNSVVSHRETRRRVLVLLIVTLILAAVIAVFYLLKSQNFPEFFGQRVIPEPETQTGFTLRSENVPQGTIPGRIPSAGNELNRKSNQHF